MKKILSGIALLLLLFTSIVSLAQTTIPYGSNKGKYQSINGVKIYYEEYGKGTPLLLIHGGLMSIGDMAPLIPELSKKFRVIAVDCPGQGRSEQADSLSYQLMANYFSKFIDAIKLDSVYVFGYSDGGNIGLLMAADRPDKVKKSVAFAAAFQISGYIPEATAALASMSAETTEQYYKWWLDIHLTKTPQKDKWKKFVTDFAKMATQPIIVPEEKLQKIQSKVLIIQGDNDIVKFDHTVKLYQSIKGSQLCIIPATSHFILMERPELLNQIAIEFFSKNHKIFDFSQAGN